MSDEHDPAIASNWCDVRYLVDAAQQAGELPQVFGFCNEPEDEEGLPAWITATATGVGCAAMWLLYCLVRALSGA